VPSRYRSDTPWEGTLPLLRLRQRLDTMPRGRARDEIARALKPGVDTATCSSSNSTLANEATSAHFYVQYSTIGGGLTIDAYVTSLESAWTTQVDAFGWAAPPVRASSPPPGDRYHVRVDNLGGGLYGFVSPSGTHAGLVGDNPATAWNDSDAYASCMVLNRDYTGFPGSPQQAMDSTTAHEFNHSIQFGYGALSGTNVPDDLFVEGGATWMEDEVQDAADDNWNYLWPSFTQGLGDYDGSPYPAWLMLRGITERYGTNAAGAGERVMQRFWEATSQGTGNNLTALAAALAPEATTIADVHHDFAIAAAFMRPCGGGYAVPFCFEEAAGYVANAGGLPPIQGAIASAGGSFTGTVEDDYATSWVSLPTGSYEVTLRNNSASGGQLRATAVCDDGTQLLLSPLAGIAGPGATVELPSFSTAGCVRSLAVVTNQHQSAGNPSNSPTRSFTLDTVSGGGGPVTVSVADATVAEGTGTTTPMTFAVTLSAPSTSTVTVAFATSTPPKTPNTATAGADYTATSTTVTFAAGDTSETVEVPVLGDSAVEPTETFNATLSAPTGATITDGTATGTITDDDSGGGPVTISVADATVAEGSKGARSLVFVVSLSAAALTDVTVTATTSDGTAVAPGDYGAKTAVVAIAAGSTTTTFEVAVVADSIAEADETLTVTLSSPSGATLGDASATGTVFDDD
jgi:hypothetical protein